MLWKLPSTIYSENWNGHFDIRFKYVSQLLLFLSKNWPKKEYINYYPMLVPWLDVNKNYKSESGERPLWKAFELDRVIAWWQLSILVLYKLYTLCESVGVPSCYLLHGGNILHLLHTAVIERCNCASSYCVCSIASVVREMMDINWIFSVLKSFLCVFV